MPLVEYRCSDCGATFERLVPKTEGADTSQCRSCGGPNGRRLLSMFAAVRGGDGASTAGAAGGCCGGACGCGQ